MCIRDSYMGGPNRRITNPRWRTAVILKNRKRPYFRNALTDLHKIWHDDAFWPPEGYGQLKFPTFENPRWRTAAILKNRKQPYLRNGSTDRHKICYDDAFWPPEVYWQLKFPTFKNPTWRTAAILKIEKRPYLCSFYRNLARSMTHIGPSNGMGS